MKKVLAVVFVSLALSAVPQVASADKPIYERGWSHGKVLTFTTTRTTSPVSPRAQVPVYVLAPIDPAAPLNPGHPEVDAHDVVIHAPGDERYTSNWQVIVVLPSDDAPAGTVAWRPFRFGSHTFPLAYAADLGAGLVPLNSVARVQQAAALGRVTLVDTGIDVVCHVVGNEP